MDSQVATGRPPLAVLVCRLIGGLLAGLVGMIFQPPLAILVGVSGVTASSVMFRRAPDAGAPRRAYLVGAWSWGMVLTFVALLAPRAVSG